MRHAERRISLSLNRISAMSLLSRTSIALIVGVALGGGLSLTHSVLADRDTAESLPLQDLQAFVEILNRVKTDYVEEIDDKTLIDNAIRGMLSGLDPHSSFLSADEFKDMSAATSGASSAQTTSPAAATHR